MREYITMLLVLLFLEQQKTIVQKTTITAGLKRFPQLEINEDDVSGAVFKLLKRGFIVIHYCSFYDLTKNGNDYLNSDELIKFIRYFSNSLLKKDLQNLVKRYTIE